MNFKRTPTLLGALAVIGVFSIPFLMKDKYASEEKKGLITDVQKNEVDKIVIEGLDKFSIVKVKSGWNIEKENYPADTSRVESILQSLNAAKIDQKITSNEKHYNKFKVDETGTKITLFVKDQQVASYIIGKSDTNFFKSYFREDDNVYLADGMLSFSINGSLHDMKEKKLFTLTKENIKEVAIIKGSRTTLIQEKDKWMIDGKEVKNGSTFITKLLNLKLNSFGTKDDIHCHLKKATIIEIKDKDNRIYHLEIGTAKDDKLFARLEDISRDIYITISKKDGSEVLDFKFD